mgnify:CR=1 FL=1
MYRDKEVKIILSEEAEEVYEELNKIVGEEKKKGVESSFHQTLLRSINRVKELLKQNPFAGDQVQKDKIPQLYIKKYEVNNIWRIELADRWRLTYTIRGDRLEIINFVINIFNHGDYDKVFGYKH